MTKIDMVTGDEFDLPLVLTQNKLPLPLPTGTVVQFLIKNSVTGARTNDAMNTCAITDAVNGDVTYSFQSTDTPTGTAYYCDVRVTFVGGKQRTFYNQVLLNVRAAN